VEIERPKAGKCGMRIVEKIIGAAFEHFPASI
jgi:hypothetical protein